MFSTKRRLTATICIVVFLVASFGMLVPSADAQLNPQTCSDAKSACCYAVYAAKYICIIFGSGSQTCQDAQYYAASMCSAASNLCNTAFSCSGN